MVERPRHFDPIAVSAESTVVAEYVPEPVKESAYQSEAALEAAFIRLLQEQAYEYLPIHTEANLLANLRAQLEALNHIQFSDDEWRRFYARRIAGANDGIVEKTVRIQEDPVQLLERDDGTTKNVTLLDKAHIHNNRLQVINQYEVPGAVDDGEARHSNRYDVTILVNGLPLVHVELKRRGVPIREAFNQINRYQRDSFWADSGLFEYVQLFVISNGTHTKYYSNTTRRQHIKETEGRRSSKSKTSNSFEFTSWWADATNKPITDLRSFAKTFFAKHTILNILTRYCVLTADRLLLVMRPYQIVATERILQRIEISTNAHELGTIKAGGYIWHTTGSGKTLTSFKTARLASQLPDVDKVLFVVDRKDLDYQTMREYDRFEKGAANSNTSTRVLKRQLESPESKIIITTIQKLSTFIAGNKDHPVYGKHVVIIFDECHRSQFGDMHQAITKSFKRYHLFGFTGTPIFAVNAGSGGNPRLKTTEQAFGDKLHTYTIVDAIQDKNVLPFHVDYVNTIRVGNVHDKQVSAIDTEKALLSHDRIHKVVAYTLEHFAQKTRRADSYEFAAVSNIAKVAAGRNQVDAIKQATHLRGFNALFATASIDAAKRYYNEFSVQQQHLPPDQRLKIALIYSYAPNEEEAEGFLGEEGFDPDRLDTSSRDFLEDAIQDYNDLFGTSYDTSADRFQNYYKDLSLRLKNREVDLAIVVNMFLTGFDATTLNTLFVDKNLRSHGLIQAYSRTNRILNSVKTYGNIVSFRDLEEETNAALRLFGNKDAAGIVLLKPYGEYYSTYAEKIQELQGRYPAGEQIIGESNQKAFIALFGAILRLQNILTSFDDFTGNEILTQRQQQDYQSVYIDLADEFRHTQSGEKEEINSDFELELIKQVEVTVDYILLLVEQYRQEHGNGDDKEIRAEISRAVSSSPSLRSKKDLIEAFVDTTNVDSKVNQDWERFIAERQQQELDTIIREEHLEPETTEQYMEAAFRAGELRETGTGITRVLPPVSRFSPEAGRSEKKQHVIERLKAFFERYFGLRTSGDQ
jgi:type I restriction enzyme R subunit